MIKESVSLFTKRDHKHCRYFGLNHHACEVILKSSQAVCITNFMNILIIHYFQVNVASEKGMVLNIVF